jgi:hypothetical protein
VWAKASHGLQAAASIARGLHVYDQQIVEGLRRGRYAAALLLLVLA